MKYWLALLILVTLAGCGTPESTPTTASVPGLATTIATDAPLPPPAADSSDILSLTPPTADERIAYGTDSQQFGDLRVPSGAGPHPVVVVIHGGYWQAMYDLTYSGFMAAALTKSGAATWNLEYRRLGNNSGGWPGTFQDVAAGVDYLRTLAPKYNLDLKRVVVIGHSAGGQLALWVAGRGKIAANSPLYSAEPLPIKGAVSLAGVVDLQQGWDLKLNGGVVGALLGGSPEQVPDRYAATSPRAMLPLGVPQRLLHGTDDPIVPISISQSYAAAAKASGDDAQLIELPGAGHFQPVDPRTPEWATVQENTLDLLGP